MQLNKPHSHSAFSGFGYKDKEGWTEHESNFTKILHELGGNSTNEIDVKPKTSLEKASELSRTRVHYRKFTRGKDLSQYSKKDLANIFGKKSLETDIAVIGSYKSKTEDSDDEPTTFGFGYNQQTLLKDSEDDKCDTFGFGYSYPQKKPSFVSYLTEMNTDNAKAKEKVKAKTEDFGISNPAYDAFAPAVVCDKPSALDTIQEEDSTREHSGLDFSTKVECNNPNISESSNRSDLAITNGSFCEVIKKKTRGSKKCVKTSRDRKGTSYAETNGWSNPSFADALNTINTPDVSENPYEVIRDKKTKSASCSTVTPKTSENLFEVVRKKKSKTKGCDNPNFAQTSEVVLSEANLNIFEVVRKKKKSEGLDNPNFGELDILDSSRKDDSQVHNNAALATTSELLYEIVRKKKKKDKGCSNPNFSESYDNSELANGIAYEQERNKDINLDVSIFQSILKLLR